MNKPEWVRMPRFRPHEHIHLKIISLVLAIGLWSIVPDATVPHIVRNVPVRLRNIPAELALAQPFQAEIEVWLRGGAVRTRDLLPGELSPRIDMSDAFAGDNTITVRPADIPTPLLVSVESIEPEQIHVVLEERVRADVPVNVVVEGSPPEGFEITAKRVQPDHVTVSGPRSRVQALRAVSTETISVAGHREPLTRDVGVLADDPLVSIEGGARARLTIRIEEVPVLVDLDGIAVRILNARYRVVINPQEIGIVLRGPPSLINQLTAANVTATIDVEGLAPRAEDYRVEPRIDFDPPALGERIEIITLRPQRRLDVHVYDRLALPPRPAGSPW